MSAPQESPREAVRRAMRELGDRVVAMHAELRAEREARAAAQHELENARLEAAGLQVLVEEHEAATQALQRELEDAAAALEREREAAAKALDDEREAAAQALTRARTDAAEQISAVLAAVEDVNAARRRVEDGLQRTAGHERRLEDLRAMVGEHVSAEPVVDDEVRVLRDLVAERLEAAAAAERRLEGMRAQLRASDIEDEGAAIGALQELRSALDASATAGAAAQRRIAELQEAFGRQGTGD